MLLLRNVRPDPHWFTRFKVIIPHVSLVLATLLYALFGAAVFCSIERPHEIRAKAGSIATVRKLQGEFLEEAWSLRKREGLSELEWRSKVERRLDSLVASTFAAFGSGVDAGDIAQKKAPQLAWSFPAGVFFATTVITTIGYGNLVPVTFWGKVFCIIYAMFGIPLALVTIADLGKFVSLLIVSTYARLKRVKRGVALKARPQANNTTTELDEANNNVPPTDAADGGSRKTSTQSSSRDARGVAVSAYFVLFILLAYTAISAAAFTFIEPWTFLNSFYYCFITMVTVGFGDLVPSSDGYLMLTILFIIVGLVLTTMCIDLVASDYLHRIHYFGRHIRSAREALSMLGNKAVSVHDWLRQTRRLQSRLGLNDAQATRLALLPPRYVHFLCQRGFSPGWFAFAPREADLMHYIDQLTSTASRADSQHNSLDSLDSGAQL